MPTYSALRRTTLSALFALPFATSVPAQQEADTDPIDPTAASVITAATDYLSGQQKIQVNWFVTYDTVIDGREKLTEIRSGATLFSRSEGFFSTTENGMKSREYYFDGSSFFINDPDANTYVAAPFDGTFEDLADRVRQEYDMSLPIWSVLSNRSHGELLTSAEAVAYVGLTRIAGRDAHHIALSNYDEDWQIWISTDPDRPELLMLVGTDPYTQGWPQYRVFFHDWEFAPDYDPAIFTYVPDEESSRMVWPKTRGDVTGSVAAPESE